MAFTAKEREAISNYPDFRILVKQLLVNVCSAVVEAPRTALLSGSDPLTEVDNSILAYYNARVAYAENYLRDFGDSAARDKIVKQACAMLANGNGAVRGVDFFTFDENGGIATYSPDETAVYDRLIGTFTDAGGGSTYNYGAGLFDTMVGVQQDERPDVILKDGNGVWAAYPDWYRNHFEGYKVNLYVAN